MKTIHLIIGLLLLIGSNFLTYVYSESKSDILRYTIDELYKGAEIDANYTILVSDYVNEIAKQNGLMKDLAVEAVQINPSEKNINDLLAKLQIYVDDTAKLQQKITTAKQDRHNTFSTFKYAKVYQIDKTATGSAN